jgi:protein-L-isoaspartate(D-aspartate) O-methyltransferase
MTDRDVARHALAVHLGRLGIRDPAVLQAVRTVPRDAFLPPELQEFAYQDTPLPIGEGQTISQPFVVALMAQEARLGPSARVLEVGTGSGYAAAIFSRIAAEVYTIERLPGLATLARARLEELGYDNVHVRHGDGTLGWPEAAPFDGILVAAGGPELPASLKEQLAPGGRLVIPVGHTPREQRLICVQRTDGRFERIDLGAVRFVPLVGQEGWAGDRGGAGAAPAAGTSRASGGVALESRGPVALLRDVAEPIVAVGSSDLGSLVERIGDARLVLLGESTHGTSEFYRMRARITRELIERHGFNLVTIEGDWPDAAQVHRWTRGASPNGHPPPFERFPTWMWRNGETNDFVRWLRDWNGHVGPERQVGFHGLDLYSLYASVDAVLTYLDEVDPSAARAARERYGCLTPWQRDPTTYARAAATGRYRLCESEVVAMLQELLARRLDYEQRDGERYLDAVQNARLVADAEQYYRTMYRGGHHSWNLRDRHMVETLQVLLAWHGENAKAVAWAHNSHVGDAEATEMGLQGQTNIGSLARGWLGDAAFNVGFGTDRGTVAAASDWGGPLEIKTLRPARPDSYEAMCNATGIPGFLLHLREPEREEVRGELAGPHLERAVGVVYRPETELQSHYFQASLPAQFDAWIWFDETRAVEPLSRPSRAATGAPAFPFSA